MADPTPTQTPPKVEKKKDPTPFPPPVEKLSDHSKEVVRIWARQSKAGIITLCDHKEGDQRCYHPAVEVMDPATGQVALKKDEQGRIYKVGRCSYVGDLHPEVRIYPPKKEDEI